LSLVNTQLACSEGVRILEYYEEWERNLVAQKREAATAAAAKNGGRSGVASGEAKAVVQSSSASSSPSGESEIGVPSSPKPPQVGTTSSDDASPKRLAASPSSSSTDTAQQQQQQQQPPDDQSSSTPTAEQIWFITQFFPNSYTLTSNGQCFRPDLISHPNQAWSSITPSPVSCDDREMVLNGEGGDEGWKVVEKIERRRGRALKDAVLAATNSNANSNKNNSSSGSGSLKPTSSSNYAAAVAPPAKQVVEGRSSPPSSSSGDDVLMKGPAAQKQNNQQQQGNGRKKNKQPPNHPSFSQGLEELQGIIGSGEGGNNNGGGNGKNKQQNVGSPPPPPRPSSTSTVPPPLTASTSSGKKSSSSNNHHDGRDNMKQRSSSSNADSLYQEEEKKCNEQDSGKQQHKHNNNNPNNNNNVNGKNPKHEHGKARTASSVTKVSSSTTMSTQTDKMIVVEEPKPKGKERIKPSMTDKCVMTDIPESELGGSLLKQQQQQQQQQVSSSSSSSPSSSSSWWKSLLWTCFIALLAHLITTQTHNPSDPDGTMNHNNNNAMLNHGEPLIPVTKTLPHWVRLGESISIGYNTDQSRKGSSKNSEEIGSFGGSTYKWQKDGLPLEGETRSHFSRDITTLEDEGTYTCIFSRDGTVWSIVETIVNLSEAPKVPSQVGTHKVKKGGKFMLSLSNVSGWPEPDYQWRLNGVLIPGASQKQYTIKNVKPSDAGTYTCLVFNIAGEVLWEEAIVDVW
jgi:hypothetical protein